MIRSYHWLDLNVKSQYIFEEEERSYLVYLNHIYTSTQFLQNESDDNY
jgi:hypothetical protein